MARKPSVRYWASRGAYCCWLRGVQYTLAQGPDDFPEGPTYKKAVGEFLRLQEEGDADRAGLQNRLLTVVNLYLNHCQTRRRERTVTARRQYLYGFVAWAGSGLRVGQLTKFQVERYIDERRATPHRVNDFRGEVTWGDSGTRTFVQSLNACLNWAVGSGLIPRNPVGKVEVPEARQRLYVVSPEDHARVLGAASRWLRPVVVVLEATGCRPGELVQAEARYFDPARNALVYPAECRRAPGDAGHKTGRRGKDRVIYLTGEALGVVTDLVRRRPAGALFRRATGRPHTLQTVGQAFRHLREKLGLPGLTAYSYRHTFATRWLEQGRPVEVLAELLGNTPAVIYRHYSHLTARHQSLRGHLEAFRGGTGSGRSPGP
jgi:integrase